MPPVNLTRMLGKVHPLRAGFTTHRGHQRTLWETFKTTTTTTAAIIIYIIIKSTLGCTDPED